MGTVGAVLSGIVGGIAIVLLVLFSYKMIREKCQKRKNYQNANHLDVRIEAQEVKEAI